MTDIEQDETRGITSKLEQEIDDLEQSNQCLRDHNAGLVRELGLAWELIKTAGLIPDTPENQWKLNAKGLAWEILKYMQKEVTI